MATFADLTHSLLTGSWKLDRARNRSLFELSRRQDVERRTLLYAGAEPGNKRPTPSQLSTPEDFKQAYERIVLIRAARQLEEDFPFFDGILHDFETFVVGDLCYRAVTGNPDADREINDYLEWQFDQVDASERLDLTKMARLAIRSMKRDGECGFIPIDTGDGIKVMYLSGDSIGNPMIATAIGPNDYNGIITDGVFGRAVLYNIFKRIPKLNAYVFDRAVLPSNFIHYYDPFRFEQRHGVTAFKNGIEKGFDLKQIEDFTRLNIKWRSSQLPYVTNEQGRPRGTGYEEAGNTPNGTPRPLSIDVDGVTQTFMKLDEGVMDYPNDFPNTQYVALTTDIRRDCAIGAKLPLEFCYRSESGGVVQRFYVDKAMATFNEDKRWLKRTLLNPLKNRMIQKGVDTGFLQLEKYGLAKDLARFKGQWQMGRSISVDYGREVTADLAQIDAGVMSPSDYTLETQGRPIEIIQGEIEARADAIFASAQRLSTKFKVPLETTLPYISKKFPNPAPAPKPAPAPGEEPQPSGAPVDTKDKVEAE